MDTREAKVEPVELGTASVAVMADTTLAISLDDRQQNIDFFKNMESHVWKRYWNQYRIAGLSRKEQTEVLGSLLQLFPSFVTIVSRAKFVECLNPPHPTHVLLRMQPTSDIPLPQIPGFTAPLVITKGELEALNGYNGEFTKFITKRGPRTSIPISAFCKEIDDDFHDVEFNRQARGAIMQGPFHDFIQKLYSTRPALKRKNDEKEAKDALEVMRERSIFDAMGWATPSKPEHEYNNELIALPNNPVELKSLQQKSAGILKEVSDRMQEVQKREKEVDDLKNKAGLLIHRLKQDEKREHDDDVLFYGNAEAFEKLSPLDKQAIRVRRMTAQLNNAKEQHEAEERMKDQEFYTGSYRYILFGEPMIDVVDGAPLPRFSSLTSQQKAHIRKTRLFQDKERELDEAFIPVYAAKKGKDPLPFESYSESEQAELRVMRIGASDLEANTE